MPNEFQVGDVVYAGRNYNSQIVRVNKVTPIWDGKEASLDVSIAGGGHTQYYTWGVTGRVDPLTSEILKATGKFEML